MLSVAWISTARVKDGESTRPIPKAYSYCPQYINLYISGNIYYEFSEYKYQY